MLFWSGVYSHCVRYDKYLNSFAQLHPDLALVAVRRAVFEVQVLQSVSCVAPRRLLSRAGSQPPPGATARLLDYGSNGLLRGGKGSVCEGGFRMPCIARWPGRIAPRSVASEMASALDLFPTVVELAGGRVPDDRPMKGRSITPLLYGNR